MRYHFGFSPFIRNLVIEVSSSRTRDARDFWTRITGPVPLLVNPLCALTVS